MEKNGSHSSYKSNLPVVIHQSIKAKIYDYYLTKNKNHWLEAFGLYCFFYDSVRYQGNNRVWLTDSFIRKGTGIGERLLVSVKHDLINMGLIAIHHDRKIKGVFGKRYIEVMYVWKPETVEKLFYQELDETTEYKIARSLILNNFNPYEEIESQDYYEFDVELNDGTEIIEASTFYFNDDELLVAKGLIKGSGEISYTVPTYRLREVIFDIANSYSFSFKAVLNTLNSPQIP